MSAALKARKAEVREMLRKHPREEEEAEAVAPSPKKRLASSPAIIRTSTEPHLVFEFDLSIGGFTISGGGSCTLLGVLFFPRVKGEKTSFALAIPDPAPYAWMQNADDDLRSVLRKTGMKAEVPPKMKTWDGAPGVSLVNFYGDNFPWMDGDDDDPRITTFTESINACQGTPIAVLARVGTKTNTSTNKMGEVVVSWPLYAQGIRLYANPPKELLDLKNATKPGVAFPALPT